MAAAAALDAPSSDSGLQLQHYETECDKNILYTRYNDIYTWYKYRYIYPIDKPYTNEYISAAAAVDAAASSSSLQLKQSSTMEALMPDLNADRKSIYFRCYMHLHHLLMISMETSCWRKSAAEGG